MSELLVYKASAGSGKTFTLAVEYIKLLILNPRAYRQILAVTFTNKATAEMKERILQQLYGICTVFRQETKDPKPISTVSKKKREKQSRKYGKQQALPLVICYTTTVGFG